MRATAPLLLGLLLAAAAPAMARQSPAAQLNAALLAGESATAVLQRICDERNAGPVQARALANRRDRRPPGWVRQALKPGRTEPVQYRRVELGCGGEVLSRAENWYLPARLTPAMNRELATRQTPFGRVVAPLGFHREILSVRFRGPSAVLRHRAVLIARDGRRFSVVDEAYASAALESR